MWAFHVEASVAAEHRLEGVTAAAVAGPGSRAQANSCGAQAQLLCGMWDLPGSGIQPMSPELAGGLFTTEPPGSPNPFDALI